MYVYIGCVIKACIHGCKPRKLTNLTFVGLENNTALEKYRRVAHIEGFYEIIHEVHEKDLSHAGYKTTFEMSRCHVSNTYTACAQLQKFFLCAQVVSFGNLNSQLLLSSQFLQMASSADCRYT